MIPRSLPDVCIAPQNPYVTLTRGELEDIYDAVESAATLRSVKRARQDPLLDKIGDFQYKLEVARSSVCHDLLIKAARYRRETLQEGPGLRERKPIRTRHWRHIYEVDRGLRHRGPDSPDNRQRGRTRIHS